MSILLELVGEAIRTLWRHRLRSLLTTLGIVFGVASVLSMVAMGEGARRVILEQISELGITNIIVNARKPPEEQDAKSTGNEGQLFEYGLTFHDARQIEATMPVVTSVLRVHDVEKWIWFKSRRISAKVRGVEPDYFAQLGLVPFVGRPLTAEDGTARRRVCVIRAHLLEEAKYVGDPLKLDLKVSTEYYRVVGVLPDVQFQSPNKTVLGIDDRTLEVYVPFDTVVDRFGLMSLTTRSGSSEASTVELHQIVCTVNDVSNVMVAAREIQAILAKLHPKKDYEITVPLELLASQQRTQRVFNIVLPIIAGISLLVGGIGILNIMLASITERVREIGTCKAIGAAPAAIFLQVLVEGCVLAGLGGVTGVAASFGLVQIIEHVSPGSNAPVITWLPVAAAVAFSLTVGLVASLIPAFKAARLAPIQALRYE